MLSLAPLLRAMNSYYTNKIEGQHTLPVEIEQALRKEFSHLSLSLLADANITPGGCLVEAAGTVVDGTIEKRWSRVVCKLGLESAWEMPHGDE